METDLALVAESGSFGAFHFTLCKSYDMVLFVQEQSLKTMDIIKFIVASEYCETRIEKL